MSPSVCLGETRRPRNDEGICLVLEINCLFIHVPTGIREHACTRWMKRGRKWGSKLSETKQKRFDCVWIQTRCVWLEQTSPALILFESSPRTLDWYAESSTWLHSARGGLSVCVRICAQVQAVTSGFLVSGYIQTKFKFLPVKIKARFEGNERVCVWQACRAYEQFMIDLAKLIRGDRNLAINETSIREEVKRVMDLERDIANVSVQLCLTSFPRVW